jgi:hypothetical protein
MFVSVGRRTSFENPIAFATPHFYRLTRDAEEPDYRNYDLAFIPKDGRQRLELFNSRRFCFHALPAQTKILVLGR